MNLSQQQLQNDFEVSHVLKLCEQERCVLVFLHDSLFLDHLHLHIGACSYRHCRSFCSYSICRSATKNCSYHSKGSFFLYISFSEKELIFIDIIVSQPTHLRFCCYSFSSLKQVSLLGARPPPATIELENCCTSHTSDCLHAPSALHLSSYNQNWLFINLPK